MHPRQRADLFRLSVIVAAAAVFAMGVVSLPHGALSWLAAAAFAAAGAVALRNPLPISLTNRVSVASTVFFAGLLLLPGPLAGLAAGAAAVVDSATSIRRRLRASAQRPPVRVIALTLAFNAAQSYLCVSLPALLVPGAHLSSMHGSGWGMTLAEAVAAGIAMYLLNISVISIAGALASGTNVLQAILSALKTIGREFAVIYATGLVAAVVLWLEPVAALALMPIGFLLHRLLDRALRLRRETITAVERMADLVDRRDPYTADHSRRVAQYVVAIGQHLRLTADDLELVRLAATVHDIGKIEVPDAILLKEGRLTAEEKAVMDAHPRTGYDLLRQFSEYARVRELVLTHHERYDGQGYPSGVLVSALPLVAQVIPVADSLDAMTSARPYRGALPWAVAFDELARGRGTQFNPDVVDAALAVFADRRTSVPVQEVA